jgi:hypothetical protein
MGATLDSIIAVNISLQAAAVQQKGFGRGLILGSSNRLTGGDLYRIYASAAAMLADTFLTSDPEYKAAVAYFSQSPSPADVMVGYGVADVAQVETITPTAVNLTLYTVTVNGVAYTYTSDGTATAAEIVTGFITAINGGQSAVTASGTTTLILTAATAGVSFTVTIGANLAIAHTTPDTGVDTALTAIVAAGGKAWYGLILTTHTLGDITQAAAWIEAQPYGYIFVGCSQDSAVLTNVSTDVASLLQAANYLRTTYLWSDDLAHCPDAAWLGREFPATPGSSNFAFKALTGVTPTTNAVLTDSKIALLDGKNGNYYVSVGGVPVTQIGKMAGGQWIDVVIGRDWIKANLQQAIFNVLVAMPKVNFDDAGIGIIANAVRGVLKQAKDNGILTDYNITVPLASSFTSAQRNLRVLPSIPFTATLAGAINGLTINGNITA